jgi:hypothetical protein
MEDMFFNIAYTSFGQMMIRIAVFLALSGLLVYVIWFIMSKMLFRKTSQRREISLRLALLWSLFGFFLLFSIYLFQLFYHTGIHRIDFLSFSTYAGIMPQLVIFTGLILYFLIERQGLKKVINENSIN